MDGRALFALYGHADGQGRHPDSSSSDPASPPLAIGGRRERGKVPNQRTLKLPASSLPLRLFVTSKPTWIQASHPLPSMLLTCTKTSFRDSDLRAAGLRSSAAASCRELAAAFQLWPGIFFFSLRRKASIKLITGTGVGKSVPIRNMSPASLLRAFEPAPARPN